tara:strand:- start:1650 stop:2129 length:480 start_codon:yes stop_codon:yes gene_type:complete
MMKRIGTREEVFRGVAERTSGGMRKQDIMIKNNKFISRKKSDRMRIMVAQNERFQTFRSNKKTKCNNNLLNRQDNRYNNHTKKPIKRTQKKVVFHINKNKVQEYNCPNLGYYCGDEEDDEEEEEEEEEEYKNSKQINFNKKPREFKIEKIEDLNIDDLF